MKSSIKNWRKIYLFYGVIFFSLGLTGVLDNENFKYLLSLKIHTFITDIQRHSDFLAVNGSEVPVFTGQSDKEIIFYYLQSLEINHTQILQEIRQILQTNYPKVEQRSLWTTKSQLPVNMSRKYQKNCLGLTVENIAGTTNLKLDFYFDLPVENGEAKMLAYLSHSNLLNFSAEKINFQNWSIYHLNWITSPKNAISDISSLIFERLRVQDSSFLKL